MDGKILIWPNKYAPDQTLYECRLQHNITKERQELRVLRKLAQWREPVTNPQSRAECLKMCSITPWDKWCLGWKLQWQWMSCILYLEVCAAVGRDRDRDRDIVEAIESCLGDEAMIGAARVILAAISREGVGLVAAKEDFVSAFKASIDRSRNDISTVHLCQSCGWGDADEAPKLIGP
jgi:hypothetical protein